MRKSRTGLAGGCFIVACALLVLPQATNAAQNITPGVQRYCQWDYHNFCSEYGIGSSLLRLCFQKHAKSLSKSCVKSLIAAGDVSKSYVMREKKALGR